MDSGQPSSALVELAEHHGITTQFHDIDGRLQRASTDALLGLLARLGAPLSHPDGADNALQAARAANDKRMVEPVTVNWVPERASIELTLPGSGGQERAELSITLDGGETRELALPLADLAPSASGQHRALLTLPELPLGRHRVELRIGPSRGQTWLLCAPERAFPSRGRSFGIFAPTYGVRAHGQGSGTYSDLTALLNFASHHQAGFVGTLPLLPVYLQGHHDPSPYAPISRLFWNEFYLDLPALAAAQGCDSAADLIADYRAVDLQQARSTERLIDYRPLAERHHRALLELSRHFFRTQSPERERLQRFVAANPEVEHYAHFRVAMERHPGSFHEWPEAWRKELAGHLNVDAAEVQCQIYAQWRAHEQLFELARQARDKNCGLYLDLPVGTHPNGYDAFAHRDSFLPDAAAGAPPDPFFSGGQNWGFAPLHPDKIREDGYAYVQACLRHHMQVAQILRIDHVMGLHRIFCIPNGARSGDGAYVRFRQEELYALALLESERHRCTLIGEDLGTVPEGVREAMEQHGLLRMYVTQFSLAESHPVVQEPPAQALASLNTHDMPPFAAFARGLDIDDRVALGLLTPEQAQGEHQARSRLLGAVRAALHSPADDDGALLQRLLFALADSPCPHVMVSLEDLWLEKAAQNVPGTQFERPNWRRRLAHALDTLDQQPDIMARLSALSGTRVPPANQHDQPK